MSKSASVATPPNLIDDSNLSRAWARLFLTILDSGTKEVSPLVLSLHSFDSKGTVNEIPELRTSLDKLLVQKGKLDVEGVAFTIFPERVWKISNNDRATLFKIYKETFPRWQAMNRKANGRGMYFERMTMYGRGRCDGNQLEWILSQHASRSGVRDSMFQATTFDPERDHVPDARLNFPCLQHASFVPTQTGLVVNAFYATQYVFDKAYGNYLGLTQLGAFMASQMAMPLARVNITVGVAKLDGVNKTDTMMTPLIDAARAAKALS